MQFLPRQCEASLCQECKLRSYATFKSSRYDFIPIECQRDSWKNSQCVLEVQDSLYYQGLIENRILSMDQKWTGNGFSSSVSIGLMLTNHTEINTIRKYQFTSSTLIWVSIPSPGEESGFGLLKTNWITLPSPWPLLDQMLYMDLLVVVWHFNFYFCYITPQAKETAEILWGAKATYPATRSPTSTAIR